MKAGKHTPGEILAGVNWNFIVQIILCPPEPASLSQV